MNNYIKVCDIEKYYGTASHVTKAIDRLSFSVNQGEFVGIMGASGSGKTTLLNLLATIDRVSSGHIFYENTDITALSEDALSEFRKHNLGFIFQQYNLLDTLTIEENIVLALTLQGGGKKKIRETCDRLLNLLPEEQSETIRLRLHSGLQYQEIAEIMDVGLSTAKARFRYGIEKIRDRLKKEKLL